MDRQHIKKVALIGAGNLAYHLGKRLVEKGFLVVQVFSRKEKKAEQLAQILRTDFCCRLEETTTEADLYLVAVTDDAIASVAETLSGILPKEALIAHTSGATPSTVFAPFFSHYGIFYPLQTFSAGREIDFQEIPVCIFASTARDEKLLSGLGSAISSNVVRIDDEQRAMLHLAAVFVNNFPNHLFDIARQILDKEKLPFGLLLPLIRETVEKVRHSPPHDMQTGPARRGDQATIGKHLKLLEKYPDFQNLYRFLTESIRKTYIK